MAIWQFEYMIIPKGRRVEECLEDEIISWKGIEIPDNAIKKISELLPQEKSWSKDIEQYGSIEGTCIKFLYEDNSIVEINCRLDLRNLSKVILTEIIAFVDTIKGDILYQHSIYELKLDIILELMRNSEQAKFCSNPKEYLETINNTLEH